MANNDFNNTMGTLFNGMDSFLTTKTVVGDAKTVGDTVIVPLVDVTFGVAAGAYAESSAKSSGAGGMAGKMSPSAVLVIQNGHTKIVNVKNQDSVVKILDMIPEVVDRITEYVQDKKNEKEEAKEDQKMIEEA